MSLRDRLWALDRAQQGVRFKLIATGVLVALSLSLVVYYAVLRTQRERALAEAGLVEPAIGSSGGAGGAGGSGVTGGGDGERGVGSGVARERLEDGLASQRRMVEEFGALRRSWRDVAALAGLGAGVGVLVVWLGLGLTYLALVGVAGGVAAPLVWSGSPWWSGVGVSVGGVTVLAGAFTALVRAVGIGLGGSGPVWSIARNVVTESVRLNISVVFVVLMILAVAGVPHVLEPSSPLRYQVQSFLQYGTGLPYLLTALLVLTLSCATVTFEQRGRVLWQTMTKPVRAWEYVLGKWVGVCCVSAALLGVTSAGVFFFTQYLRNRPANGEAVAYVPLPGQSNPTPDRLAIEYQILTARQSRLANVFKDRTQEIEEETARRTEASLKDQVVPDSYRRETERRIRDAVTAELLSRQLAIEPGDQKGFEFEGLGSARESGRPMTLRFKIDAGGNNPTEFYKVTFVFGGNVAVVREAALGQFASMPMAPELIDPDGVLRLVVVNGDLSSGVANAETMSFPPGGLEVSYPVGRFAGNYVRAMAAMWLKLCLLAMIGITAATFLSFPVAMMVAVTVFVSAEGASFLRYSLETYATVETGGDTYYYRYPIRAIAIPIVVLFSPYSELRPVGRLVEGLSVPWSTVGRAGVVVAVLVAGLWAVASGIMRRRELALYSGQ